MWRLFSNERSEPGGARGPMLRGPLEYMKSFKEIMVFDLRKNKMDLWNWSYIFGKTTSYFLRNRQKNNFVRRTISRVSRIAEPPEHLHEQIRKT